MGVEARVCYLGSLLGSSVRIVARSTWVLILSGTYP